MTPHDLADTIDAALGPVPEPLLAEQAARWERAVRAGERTRRAPPRLALALAAIAALSVVGLVVGLAPRLAPPSAVTTEHTVVAARGDYEFSVAMGEAPLRVQLTPTELLALSPGTSGRVERPTPQTTDVRVQQGTVALTLPTGTRHTWTVLAGPYRVEVVGTEFSVTWEPKTERLLVAVVRGTVRVSGGGIAAPQLLGAGERLDRAPTPVVASPAAPVGSAAGGPAPAASAAPGWRALHAQRQYRDALAAAEREGFDRLCGSLAATELAALADAARLAGSSVRAQQALESLRHRFPGTPEAATAAFLFGRQGASAAHNRWLETYLTEQPGGPYAQEALGRLLVNLRAGGDLARARARAREYLGRYPGGAYAEHARSIVEAPPPAASR